jgi:ATP-dependent DNA helicase RecQ
LRNFIERGEATPERRRVEMRKLDDMLAYCETADCRRGILLAYFGEAVAAGGCGSCDTCLAPPERFDGTEAAQMALSAVMRTGQRFGAGHLVDVLRGHATEKIARLGHDRLPTFGVGAERDEREWRRVLRQLVVSGLLEPDPDGHGGLRATAAADEVLRGRRRVELRRASVAERAPRTRRKRGGVSLAAVAALPAGPGDDALFDALREWRRGVAAEIGKPAYVVFADRTLAEIARLRPAALAALREVSGVGDHKLERYGDDVLAVVRAHAGTAP